VSRFYWPIRFLLTIAAGAVLITGTLVGIAPRMWRATNAHEQVPVALPPIQPLSQRTLVYNRAGGLIAAFERENSQPIALSQVPAAVVSAFLAVEDNEYYLHHGVNLRSFMRAMLSNFSTDAARQGASTITQQVVKNEFLAGLPRDGRYKGLQAHYATMLEKQMTKDQILERYLNTVFFGNNAYGLQAAAEVYFGKTVEQLDHIEGAFLAGLVRSPSGYDPIRRLEPSRNRFEQVLDRLVDTELMSPEQAEALAESWQIPEQVRTIETVSTERTYYTEALRLYLLEKSNLLGDTEQERANLLYRGGLRIYTTLDPSVQDLAERARDTLPDNQAGIDAALVTLDTTNGAIRAMVGGRGYGVPSEINMALVPRQTGSSIKIFILAAAIQAGAQPNDTIDGTAPCTFTDPNAPPSTFSLGSEDRIATRGVVTLEEQTWASINCAYARLSQIVGLNRVVDTTYRMASSAYLNPSLPSDERTPLRPYGSFATGANEMSPLDMAAGMQTIANQGVHKEPYYVEYIDRVDGTRLYTHDDQGVQVLDQNVALLTTSTLKGVLSRGTARSALSSFPRPAAGKTGTQDSNTTSYFVGSTPELTTAVWVGNPDAYTPMNNIPQFVRDGVARVQGGTYPARIWRALMEPATAGLPVTDWAAPPPLMRPSLRLYLPGNECLGQRTVVAARSATPTATTAAPAAPAPAGNLLMPAAPPSSPPSAAPPSSAAGPPSSAAPPGGPETTTAPSDPVNTTPATRVIVRQLDSGTTIPPEVLDPRAPLNTAAAGTYVYNCQP
jgi:penicillin-binding protein 1A